MHKAELIKIIAQELERQLETAISAAKQAHDTATDDENVAENKYDTLGLEAAYLAEGQSRRVSECELNLQRYRAWQLPEFEDADALATGALVTLEDTDSGTHMHVFLSIVAGGTKVKLGGEEVLLVTADAPLGKALMGAELGDEVSVGTNSYEIREAR